MQVIKHWQKNGGNYYSPGPRIKISDFIVTSLFPISSKVKFLITSYADDFFFPVEIEGMSGGKQWGPGFRGLVDRVSLSEGNYLASDQISYNGSTTFFKPLSKI